MDHVYVMELEQIDQNAYYFCTSNYVIGIFDKDREIIFRSLYDFENNVKEIYQMKLYNNLFS